MPIQPKNTESERRFLVNDMSIIDDIKGMKIQQGYLYHAVGWEMRVRKIIFPTSNYSWRESPYSLTLKGPRAGITRPENNIPIPENQANDLMDSAFARIYKTRHPVNVNGVIWEVDVFEGANKGLVLAECEDSEESLTSLVLPEWVGREVSTNTRYNNLSLAQRPYVFWQSKG